MRRFVGVGRCKRQTIIELGRILSRHGQRRWVNGQFTGCRGLQRIVGSHINAAVRYRKATHVVCTVVVSADLRAVGRCVVDSRRMAIQQVAEDRSLGTLLFLAVVLDRFVCHAHRDVTFGDFQRAFMRVHDELGRHIIAVGILDHSCTADGVVEVADIDAARITRVETAHRIDMAIVG